MTKPSKDVLAYLMDKGYRYRDGGYVRLGVKVLLGNENRPWWTLQKLRLQDKIAEWFVDVPREAPDELVIGMIQLLESGVCGKEREIAMGDGEIDGRRKRRQKRKTA
ncbi:MAG: hypothetical protein KatS3mg109_0104 [Pirellulaceae bacterium]|nr:MAG: hypothetical protein KatS3mg109_0104 [Pirellulaceae bacterium]